MHLECVYCSGMLSTISYVCKRQIGTFPSTNYSKRGKEPRFLHTVACTMYSTAI